MIKPPPTFRLLFDTHGFIRSPPHNYSQAETEQIIQDLLDVCVVLAEGEPRRLRRACLALGIPAPHGTLFTSRRADDAINGVQL